MAGTAQCLPTVDTFHCEADLVIPVLSCDEVCVLPKMAPSRGYMVGIVANLTVGAAVHDREHRLLHFIERF